MRYAHLSPDVRRDAVARLDEPCDVAVARKVSDHQLTDHMGLLVHQAFGSASTNDESGTVLMSNET